MLTKPINNSETKVKKEKGKGLSTNDFTNAYKEKLDNVGTGSSNAEIRYIGKTKIPSTAWENDSTFADYPFKATISVNGITEVDWWCELLTPNAKDEDFSKAISPYVHVGDNNFSIYSKVKFDRDVFIENAVFETDNVNPPSALEQGQLIKLGTLYRGDVAQDVPDGLGYDKTTVPAKNEVDFTIGNTVKGKELQWRYANLGNKKLLIGDRIVARGISWDTLNTAELIKGKTITIDEQDYKLCSLTGGTKESDINNDWDRTIANGIGEADNSNAIWHWENMYTWCQNGNTPDSATKVMRGYDSSYGRQAITSSEALPQYGYRPVLEILSENKTYPNPVTGMKVISGTNKLTILWTDPTDKPTAKWKGTKVVYKEGSYPTSPTDGILVTDNTVRNQYQSKGFEISGLTNDTNYYIAFFPYSYDNLVNNSVTQRILGTPKKPKYYGVKIDYKNSNPESSCTYLGDAIGMKAGDFAGVWRQTPIFKNIKPCVLKEGVVQYYLQKDNLTLKEDGEPSVLTGADGDVMVEVPRMGYKLVTAEDRNSLEVWITDGQAEEGYCYLAHSLDDENDCDKIYYGAYLSNPDVHSYADNMPEEQSNLSVNRPKAKAFGKGYQLASLYPMILLQCLYIILYKNLDSQTALGKGYTGGSFSVGSGSDIEPTTTGATKAKPECYGTTNDREQMKFLNIEDLWGNLEDMMDGVYIDGESLWYYYTTYKDFELPPTQYLYKNSSGISRPPEGSGSGYRTYIRKVQGNNILGFLPSEDGVGESAIEGSSTTYFCDEQSIFDKYAPTFGGTILNKESEGVFYIGYAYIDKPEYYSNTRLMYKHKEV